jgi:hypothetical protein
VRRAAIFLPLADCSAPWQNLMSLKLESNVSRPTARVL